MKRKGNLFITLISDENLLKAINEVNKTHHYIGKGNTRRVNKTTLWVELTKEDRVKELRLILLDGFIQSPMRKFRLYDVNARKWRDISEPVQYPDQYIHHAIQLCLQPIMMKGMDYYCCGSIRGRGAKRGIDAIKKWMNTDIKGTKYAIECDIHHYYDSIDPTIAFKWFKNKIKDKRVLDTIWAIISNGITIGGFFSQWVANSILQDIDQKIRLSGLCNHYVRYIDNFTILGSNKQKLIKLLKLIEKWLSELYLRLKDNKQIFKVDNRMVTALGYRFNHQKTYLKKYNLLKIRRKINKIVKKMNAGRSINHIEASCILSRLGLLCHCDSSNLRKTLYKKGFITIMKFIIRLHDKRREKFRTWKYTLSQALIMQKRLILYV